MHSYLLERAKTSNEPTANNVWTRTWTNDRPPAQASKAEEAGEGRREKVMLFDRDRPDLSEERGRVAPSDAVRGPRVDKK